MAAATGNCILASNSLFGSLTAFHPVRSRYYGNSGGKQLPAISAQLDNYATFSSSLGTDIPFRENPKVPFEAYLKDRQRVFEALFPDKRRCEKLNDKDWRIFMLPLDFVFLTAKPVVDLRIVVQPPSSELFVPVSENVGYVLTLEAIKWELRGLDYVVKPSDLLLTIQGILFSEKRGSISRLRGNLKLSVRFVMPLALTMIPKEVMRSVGEAVLRGLLESMKEKVNNKLLEDYKAYSMEPSIIKATNSGHTQVVRPAS